MKKLSLFLSALTGLAVAYAQPDMQRMDRDIDVFTKVLNELFKNNNGFAFGQAPSDGTYVPGYGVIIQVPVSAYPDNFAYFFNDELEEALEQSRVTLEELKQETRNIKDRRKHGNGKEIEEEIEKGSAPCEHDTKTETHTESVIITDDPGMAVAVSPHAPQTRVVEAWAIPAEHLAEKDRDSMPVKKQQEIIDKMKAALEQYGDLLGQVQPGEKVMLVYDEAARNRTGSFYFRFSGSQTRTAPRITAEVKREDVLALSKGSINAGAFRERIRVSTDKVKEENTSDCRIFAGILQAVLTNSGLRSYSSSGAVNFTYLPGFGAIYYTRMRYLNTGTAASEAKAREDLKELEKTLKTNLLDYGRALKSIKDDQFILLNVDLSQGREANTSLSLRVKKETIMRYDRKEVSLDKAMQEIGVLIK